MHSVSCCEFHSHVPATWKQRKTQMNHWNLPVDVGTLSSRVSMMHLGVHMWKTKTTCVYTQLWQNKMAVSRYPVPFLKNSPYKSQTRQSWVDVCRDLVEEKKTFSSDTKGRIKCIVFFVKKHIKHLSLYSFNACLHITFSEE